jgi:cation diffusion facilitator CzcD-associated flavoprotein CzcO
VLVIGVGNSGGDMVVELGRIAKQVLIKIQSFRIFIKNNKRFI